ncbi:adenosine deaminase-like [Anneissia japonica]|uniref:adenosine deaminase-like n=1 Tax=Anneissia japonica TaxID=1529436 RepID=UPI001425ABF9|nr:adenosine deaminase-like [Anneissia japonica]
MNRLIAVLSKSRKLKSFIRMASSFKEGLCRVELHCHLDGCCRPETIWNIAKRRGMMDALPGNTLEEFLTELRVSGSGTLAKFLHSFEIYMPVLKGDRVGIKEIATELCQDKMNDGAVYFEATYCPHFLSDDNLTTEEVVQLVNEGFKEGEKKFGVKARSILCMIRDKPEWCREMVELCDKYRSEGVVGIGIAGDESVALEIDFYQGVKEAIERNICRTIHAGESGPASNVQEAIEVFKAQRVGHGYHCVEDDNVYELVKKTGVHLEVCPTSSNVLGNVSPDWTKHPAIRFAKDNVNFSLNTDDTLHFNNSLQTEEDIAMKYFGMSKEDIITARVYAAEATFLPEGEKRELVEHVKKFSVSV